MSERRILWSIWQMPVGPESLVPKKRLFHGSQEEVMAQYERLRNEEQDGTALVVRDQRGDPLYCCS